MKSKMYYKKLDILRIIACVMVLLYHLNILKGGYLAVCIFFVLTSYLSCLSFFRKSDMSLLSYYKSRLIKVYIPLLVVVFITIATLSFFPNINFYNLKPETTSVLLGYNNFWQLQANLDYFAHHIDSPFMHFWYISILMQFDLIFPFIFSLLKKIGEKVHKFLPVIITLTLSLISFIFFYINVKENIMYSYYNTFTRSFSLLLGMSLAFYENSYKNLIPTKFKKKANKIFWGYLIIIIFLSLFIDSKSIFMPISMLLVSLITLRLISYSKVKTKRLKKKEDIIKNLAQISYEIYLGQYPLIFLLTTCVTNIYFKAFLVIILIFPLALILHFSLDYQNPNYKIGRIVSASLIIIFSLFGFYKFIIAEDHTKEMHQLEELLNQNEELLKEKQAEYAKKRQEEEQSWYAKLEEMDASYSDIDSLVTNLPVVGIGDSVMLGAVNNLYQQFPQGYFDAKVSRTAWAVADILKDLKDKKLLGNPIIFNLGTNGDCRESCRDNIMAELSDKQVFWVTVTNDSEVNFNTKIKNYKEKYANLHIIDWETISKGHSEYFVADGIHLTASGRKAYTKAIYDAIYEVYYNEYLTLKENMIKDHEEQLKNKISFYGNDLLLNLYPYMQEDFNDSLFMINKDYDFSTLQEELKKSIEEDTLTKKIVLALDNLTKEEYLELSQLLKSYEVYLITFKKVDYLFPDNIKVIDFSSNTLNNANYLLKDGKHLSQEGNEALRENLIKILGKN